MDDKVITIITTIHPVKRGGKRAITVAAAPEGELPLMLTGVFADRHQLADRAFGELIKRKPVTPKLTPGKAAKEVAESEPAEAPAAPELAVDEVGPIETPATEPLPAIAGDDAGDLPAEETETEGSDE